MNRRIELLNKQEDYGFLMKITGCTYATIRNALTFKQNSDLSIRIRNMAMQRGGKLIGEKAIVVDTSFATGENTMEQMFGSRVKLVADFTTGKIGVYIDKELKSVHQPTTIEEFMRLQESVREAAERIDD